MLATVRLLMLAAGCAGHAAPTEEPAAADLGAESKACVECHTAAKVGTAAIEEWKKSTHAAKGVGCYECHKAEQTDKDALDHNGFTIAVIVSPNDCARCHEKESKEFQASHHAKAGEILGSDFDGCTVPAGIGDVAGLPRLVAAMREAGYGEELIAKICHRNWLNLLRRTI